MSNLSVLNITVFSETMIRFSNQKHFWVKKVVSVARDKQIDNKCESINQSGGPHSVKYVTCTYNTIIRQVSILKNASRSRQWTKTGDMKLVDCHLNDMTLTLRSGERAV